MGMMMMPPHLLPAYHRQVALPLEYKGHQIAKGYVIDLLIEDSLIVEIKAVDKLLPIHSAQLMTYLRLLRISVELQRWDSTRRMENPALTLQFRAASVSSVFPW
jgi:hypothetical protein